MTMQFSPESVLTRTFSGITGSAAACKSLAYTIGITAVIAIVVASLTACTAEDGAVGWPDIHNFILEDSDIIGIGDIAALLELEEIPGFAVELGWGSPNDDDPEEWKNYLRHSLENELGSIGPHSVDDITLMVTQQDADLNVIGTLVVIDNFQFNAIRDTLDDEFGEADTFYGIDVWDNRNVTLLRDQKAIIFGYELVSGVLRSLTTGKGSIVAAMYPDKGWALKRALDKVGDALVILAIVECADQGNVYIVDSLHSCDAVAIVVGNGGTDAATDIELAYVFRSDHRAESVLKDLDEYGLDVIEINRIETEGQFVAVEITVRATSLSELLGF